MLILASKSPRRKAILRSLEIRFSVIPSCVRETRHKHLEPAPLVQFLALKKALWIAKRYPGRWTLAADTLVFLNKRILGQPGSLTHAKRMLRSLSGSKHEVLTGLALIRGTDGRVFQDYGRSGVRFRVLTKKEINFYAKKHQDKAGCYAIQEKKDPVAKVVSGEYSNVVGLPVATLKKLLRKAEFRK